MVTAHVEWTETSRLDAISAAGSRLLTTMALDPGKSCVWSLLDVVWPGLTASQITATWLASVSLSLVPLARVGQMEGKSGSLVLVGRFHAAAAARPSHPLIVKTRRKSDARLRDEWDQAMLAKPHTYDRRDSFAIPIAFDDESDFEVLWSLCMPNIRESETPVVDLSILPKVRDLRELLRESRTDDLAHTDPGQTLRQTYALLRNLHRDSASRLERPARDERTWGEEYEWYLRGYSPSGGAWGAEWGNVWDAGTKDDGPAEAMTPPQVVKALQSVRAIMQMGTVHGDLHPGNILLRANESPAIIDFGWARTGSHIAKDFVLMECNLRFMFLRPQIRHDDLEAFSNWVDWDASLPEGLPAYLVARAALISEVRGAARDVFLADTDWISEYLVPLFLTAFGLLRFAPQLGNQVAAVMLVEALAKRVAAYLVDMRGSGA